MKILLITPPSFAPTVMPYSLAMLKATLRKNIADEIICLDLNAIFHYNELNNYYKKEFSFELLDKFIDKSRKLSSEISKNVLNKRNPKGFDKIIKLIESHKPDIIGMSLTYNSQIFYAKSIIDNVKSPLIIGGPADFSKVMGNSLVLPSAEAMVTYLVNNGATKKESKFELSFDDFDKKHYFTKDIVYPLRTSYSCPYQRCTFCTHHGNAPYKYIELDQIKNIIISNNMKKVFLIDDDFPVNRLLQVSEILGELNIEWWCQLRPLKKLIEVLSTLKKNGLKSVAWGLESGCQRVLEKMEKGTIVEDISTVLKESNKLGIKNMVYVMFGLPTETKEEFMETIVFLEKNSDYIDIISPSVFGLQQGSRIYDNPSNFGVKNVTLKQRTYLSDKVSFDIISGLSVDEVNKLKKKNIHRIYKINKLPRIVAHCKEQVLN